MNIKTFVICVAAVVSGLGCSEDENPGNGGPDAGGSGGGEFVSFAEDIHPILLEKCAGGDCHSTDFTPFRPGHAQADVDDAYAITQVETSAGVYVYDRMVSRASGMDSVGPMPPRPGCNGTLGFEDCLTEEEFALLELWVEQGARP